MKYQETKEELENYESLGTLRRAKAKEGDAETVSFEIAKKVSNIKI